MYRCILVLLDESKSAEAILPHAIDLDTRYDAEVLLLRVFEGEPILLTDEAVETGPDIQAGRELQRLHGVEDYLAFWQNKLGGLGSGLTRWSNTVTLPPQLLGRSTAKRLTWWPWAVIAEPVWPHPAWQRCPGSDAASVLPTVIA